MGYGQCLPLVGIWNNYAYTTLKKASYKARGSASLGPRACGGDPALLAGTVPNALRPACGSGSEKGRRMVK